MESKIISKLHPIALTVSLIVSPISTELDQQQTEQMFPLQDDIAEAYSASMQDPQLEFNTKLRLL